MAFQLLTGLPWCYPPFINVDTRDVVYIARPTQRHRAAITRVMPIRVVVRWLHYVHCPERSVRQSSLELREKLAVIPSTPIWRMVHMLLDGHVKPCHALWYIIRMFELRRGAWAMSLRSALRIHVWHIIIAVKFMVSERASMMMNLVYCRTQIDDRWRLLVNIILYFKL